MELPAVPNLTPANRLRPPGALSEDQLTETCPGCGDCIEVCPQQIIELDMDRLPVMTSAQDCTQCGLCVDICMFGALHHTAETQAGLAEILRSERDDQSSF